MRTLSSFVLAIALSLPTLASAEEFAFSDVPFVHPNAEAIEYVKAEGMVKGYSDGTYRPEATINRAEFLKIAVLALYKEHAYNDSTQYESATQEIADCMFYDDMAYAFADGGSGLFADIHSYRPWYVQYVCIAKYLGFVRGYPDGTFRPSAKINFAEAAKIIVKATYDFEVGESQFDAWYQPYVERLSNEHAIPTTISSLDQKITRGEMAEIIYRIHMNVANDSITTKPSRTYEDLNGSVQLVRHVDFQFSTQKQAVISLGGSRNQHVVVQGDKLNAAISLREDLDTNFDETWLFFGELQGKPSRMIGGESSYVFVSDERGYCDGPGCSGPYLAYAIAHEGRVYTFLFWNDIYLSTDEQAILDSFSFSS